MDTILYEIDMLRHCANGIEQKQQAQNASDDARAEYYLGIEGFLLHLRNLLAFFAKPKVKQTDLVINEPLVWAGQQLDEQNYSRLIETAKEFDNKYGNADDESSTCYGEISKFLEHCTTHRYERAKGWAIDEMFAEIDPVLSSFERAFAGAVKVRPGLSTLGPADNSTASFRISSTGRMAEP